MAAAIEAMATAAAAVSEDACSCKWLDSDAAPSAAVSLPRCRPRLCCCGEVEPSGGEKGAAVARAWASAMCSASLIGLASVGAGMGGLEG